MGERHAKIVARLVWAGGIAGVIRTCSGLASRQSLAHRPTIPVSEPETVEFVLDGSIAGQPVSASGGVPFLRFQEFNEEVQKFVQGSDDRSALRDLSVQITDGSYRLAVIIPAGLMATLVTDISRIAQSAPLTEVDPNRAKVALRWQERAKLEPNLRYGLRSPRGAFSPVVISSESNLVREERVQWVNVERYFVGEITDWGGAQKPNIHLRLRNTRDTILVDATEDQIRNQRENLVFHKAIVHARAKQNPKTGELKDYRLIELRAFQPNVSEARLQELFEKGATAWRDVPNASAWVNEQRGDTYG